MRTVFGLVLVLGVALAGFAVYLARENLASYQAQIDAERANRPEAVDTVDVFITTRAFAYGERVTKADVRTVRFTKESLPEGTFSTMEELFPLDLPPYRTVSRALEISEPILAVKVTKPGQDAGVSSRLNAGMRAFAISVDVASGVSGFLRPGDRVDVYWSGRSNANGGDSQEITMLIEASVRLIAIDQIADNDRASPTIARTVTVEATPRQIAALAQAQNTGKLSLSLVGVADETVTGAVEINQGELLGVTEAVVTEQKSCSIRTRRGAEIIETPIACPSE